MLLPVFTPPERSLQVSFSQTGFQSNGLFPAGSGFDRRQFKWLVDINSRLWLSRHERRRASSRRIWWTNSPFSALTYQKIRVSLQVCWDANRVAEYRLNYRLYSARYSCLHRHCDRRSGGCPVGWVKLENETVAAEKRTVEKLLVKSQTRLLEHPIQFFNCIRIWKRITKNIRLRIAEARIPCTGKTALFRKVILLTFASIT